MSLTPENVTRLKDFFPVRAHEFLNGNCYISEEAITNRLDEVDPSWTMELLSDEPRGNQCVAVMRLTVCGVSRDGVGMQPLTITKKDGTVIDGTEPEKSAATDALKRAARLFGIGRYILEMGRAVNDYRTLETWLTAHQRVDTSTGEIILVQNAPISNDKADLPRAAGENEIQAANPPERAKQALNGNGHQPGKKNGSDDSKSLEWVASAVTVNKDRNGKPYLVYTCQEGKATGRGRDLLKKAGYKCDDWTVEGLTYDLTPYAMVTVQKNGEYFNVTAVKTTADMQF